MQTRDKHICAFQIDICSNNFISKSNSNPKTDSFNIHILCNCECVQVIFVDSESQALRVGVESESSKIFETRHDLVEWSHKNCWVIVLQAWVNVESNKISLLSATFHAMKWRPACCEMVPHKLENGTQCCFSKFDCSLFISNFFQFAFCLSPSHSVISTSVAQTCCKCCNVSVSVVLNVRFTKNRMCFKVVPGATFTKNVR